MSEKQLRELDAFIAEHVFGFDMAETSVDDIERYTTDPAAAMLVLEKCCDKLEGFEITVWRGEKWHCGLRKGNTVHQKADTLPLAICLFAKELFAKEGK